MIISYYRAIRLCNIFCIACSGLCKNGFRMDCDILYLRFYTDLQGVVCLYTVQYSTVYYTNRSTVLGVELYSFSAVVIQR